MLHFSTCIGTPIQYILFVTQADSYGNEKLKRKWSKSVFWGGGPKIWSILWQRFLKKKQNAPKPSEHPPVRGENMSKRLGGIKGCKYKPLHGI